MRKTNQWLIGEENKTGLVMQKNRWDFFPHCVVFFFFLAFFFSDMVDKFLWSVVLLLLYEAHARRNAVRHPPTLISSFFCLFFLFFFLLVWGFWLEDAGESLWYKICYSMYVLSPVCRSLTLASDWSRKRFTRNTHSWSHMWPTTCTRLVLNLRPGLYRGDVSASVGLLWWF